jgi:hypothetical protein
MLGEKTWTWEMIHERNKFSLFGYCYVGRRVDFTKGFGCLSSFSFLYVMFNGLQNISTRWGSWVLGEMNLKEYGHYV